MTEIRVAWQFGLHGDEAGEPPDGGVWFPEAPRNRRELTVIVEAGNEVAGEESLGSTSAKRDPAQSTGGTGLGIVCGPTGVTRAVHGGYMLTGLAHGRVRPRR